MMKKRAYLAAAAICAAGIGIAGAYLTACGNEAKQTAGGASEMAETAETEIPEEAAAEETAAE